MIQLRRTTYQGAYVIEGDEGEGRGFAFLKFNGKDVLAWRSEANCDREIQSVAAQLRAAGKEVTILPPT